MSAMTSRIQVTLPPDQHRRARHRASHLGISFAEYIRRLIEDDLRSAEQQKADISVIFGLGNSGGSDVATYKDEYVGDAVDALNRRP
jgi:hypothetical protein